MFNVTLFGSFELFWFDDNATYRHHIVQLIVTHIISMAILSPSYKYKFNSRTSVRLFVCFSYLLYKVLFDVPSLPSSSSFVNEFVRKKQTEKFHFSDTIYSYMFAKCHLSSVYAVYEWGTRKQQKEGNSIYLLQKIT